MTTCILDCIHKLQDLQGQAVECPLCQRPTIIPLTGIESLATNLNAVGLGKPEKVPEKCSHCIRKVYPPKPVTLFCRDCEASYCGNCSDIEHLKPENVRHSIILETARTRPRTSSSNGTFQFSDGEFTRQSTATSFGKERSLTPSLHSRPSSSQILDTDTIPGATNLFHFDKLSMQLKCGSVYFIP